MQVVRPEEFDRMYPGFRRSKPENAYFCHFTPPVAATFRPQTSPDAVACSEFVRDGVESKIDRDKEIAKIYRDTRMSYEKIGKLFGVSGTCVGDIIKREEKRVREEIKGLGADNGEIKKSPVGLRLDLGINRPEKRFNSQPDRD